MATQYVSQPNIVNDNFAYQVKRVPDGSLGVDYFYVGDGSTTPITRENFSKNTGLDYGAIEEQAFNSFEGADQARADYAQSVGTPIYDSGGTETTSRTAASVPRYEPPVDTAAAQASAQAAKEAAQAETDKQYEIGAYQQGIDSINRLLGISEAQRGQGIADINRSYDSQNSDLRYQRDSTMDAYNRQGVENNTDKAAGIASVDQFANRSYNNLMRMLGGAGAGNSSTARTVVPTLVSKAGNTRRQGVFDTAGKNQENIDTARNDATWQFDTSQRDLNDWKSGQERDLNTGIENNKADLLSKLYGYQMDKAQAEGSGYSAARMANRGTQSSIDANTAALDALFGSTKTAAPVRQFTASNPALSKYNVDSASVNINNTNPDAGGYYGSTLKKKQELTF